MSDESARKGLGPAYDYAGGKSLPRVPPLVAKAVQDMLQREHKMIRPPVYAAPLLALIVKLWKERKPFPLRDDVAEALGCSVHTVDAALSTRIDQGYLRPRVETRPGAVERRDSTIRVLYYDPAPELIAQVEEAEELQRSIDRTDERQAAFVELREELRAERRRLYREKFMAPDRRSRPWDETSAEIAAIEQKIESIGRAIHHLDIWYRAPDGTVTAIEAKPAPKFTSIAPPAESSATGCECGDIDRATQTSVEPEKKLELVSAKLEYEPDLGPAGPTEGGRMGEEPPAGEWEEARKYA